MTKQAIGLLTILVTAGSFSVIGQMGPKVVADIPFSFVAGTKILPPGQYEFQSSNLELDMMVRNSKTGESVIVPVLTRLGQRSGNEAEAIFDVAAKEFYLAELHVPGIDGFAFKAAPSKHTHIRVKVTHVSVKVVK